MSLLELKGSLYTTDFLDIFITALFIYSLVLFLRTSKNYFVFVGLSFSFILYIIARNFNLYLTLMALRYLAGVSVLIIAIVFQTEIRKYLELIGLIGTRQIKAERKSPTTTEIVQACVKMAQSKTGALIAIQGKDSIDRFLEGGVSLDGVISEEVLLSIFDPHSEGHDGALIINNNRIHAFGVHLPLSTNFKEIGKHGTRHSAALGLSEETDVMCIVVSEEKGKISICRDGKMKTLIEFSELEKEVEKFINSKFANRQERWFLRFFKHNLKYKVGSVGLASIVWFFSAYQAGIVEKKYTIPVTFEKLNKDTIIENFSPKEVSVSLKGRGESIFAAISDGDIKIDVDVSDVKSGLNKINLTKSNVTIPAGTSLVHFEPNVILVSSEKYITQSIPVSAKIKGKTPEGTELKNTAVTPDVVEVLVPQGTPAPKEIPTEVIDVSNQNESVIIPVKLVLEEKIKLVGVENAVNVALDIEKTDSKK